MKKKEKKQYELVNKHPKYKDEEQREKAYKEAGRELYKVYKQHNMFIKK